MGPIDYSKWDRLVESESSNDGGSASSSRDGSPERDLHRPQVTKLEYPSRMVIGPNGVQVESSAPPKATASCFQHGGNVAALSPSKEVVHTLDDEDTVLYQKLMENGGREGNSHLWSQTSDTAHLSFLLPHHVKSKDITYFALTDEPVGVEKAPRCRLQFRYTHPQGKTVTEECSVDVELQYPVRTTPDLIEGCWQLHTLRVRRDGQSDEVEELRLLSIELFKASIAVGMTLWWDRCLTTDVQSVIDTATISARTGGLHNGGNKSSGNDFQRVWNEAHAIFRERMKQRRSADSSSGTPQ